MRENKTLEMIIELLGFAIGVMLGSWFVIEIVKLG
jgi:hypothetical protein